MSAVELGQNWYKSFDEFLKLLLRCKCNWRGTYSKEDKKWVRLQEEEWGQDEGGEHEDAFQQEAADCALKWGFQLVCRDHRRHPRQQVAVKDWKNSFIVIVIPFFSPMVNRVEEVLPRRRVATPRSPQVRIDDHGTFSLKLIQDGLIIHYSFASPCCSFVMKPSDS